MKITFDIDCTPEEARLFLGLPDVKPMQDALLDQLRQRMESALSMTDPDTMIKTWLPAQVQGMEQLQKMFWSQFGAAPKRAREKAE